jgi:hypothetical protein
MAQSPHTGDDAMPRDTEQDARPITEILRANGFGHYPLPQASGDSGVHAIFSFNTMEVVGEARAHKALQVAGIA